MSGWDVLILAAGRGPDDPMAKAYGVSHKCLIPVGGVPMLRRVVATLSTHPLIGRIVVCSDDPAIVSQALGALAGRVETVGAANSAPSSARQAIGKAGLSWPVLITTGDHALLDQAMLDHFLTQSAAEPADLTVGLARAETILAAFPDAKRTYLRFAKDRVSGCNLFAAKTDKALKALAFWERADRNRKQPWKLIGMFGPAALLAWGLGRIDLQQAFARASRIIGLEVRPVLMPFATAAVDIDKPADKDLAERILAGA